MVINAWWRGLNNSAPGQRYKNLYNLSRNPIEFRGSALDDLRGFPHGAMREAGYQLHKVQHGLPPDDAKAMPRRLFNEKKAAICQRLGCA